MPSPKPDQNVSFHLDDDFSREIEITDEDTGEPLDLTNALVEAFVKPSSGGSTTYHLTTESGGGLAITNAEGGVVQLQLTRDVQSSLSMVAASNLSWALKVQIGGVEKAVCKGTFSILASLGSIDDE